MNFVTYIQLVWKTNVIARIVLLIATIITLYILVTLVYYLYKNQLLIGISDKYTIESTFNTSSNKPENFNTSDIGDFLSGYFGLFVGFVGILFTFLAFQTQFQANQELQKQTNVQQFENQLQKYIDIYLNNKDKFKNNGYKNPTNQAVDLNFITIGTSFDRIKEYSELSKKFNVNFIEYTTDNQYFFQKLLVELKVIYRVILESIKINENLKEEHLTSIQKQVAVRNAYFILFYGLNKYNKHYPQLIRDFDTKNISNIKLAPWAYTDTEIINRYPLSDKVIKCFINTLYDLKIIHKNSGVKEFKNFYLDHNNNSKNLWLRLNYIPFRGYMHFLPQYYRNLFSIVKYIDNVNEKIISNDSKKEYFKILRSTLSNDEQVLIFYNWYSNLGKDWENSQNKYLTEYKMIHNIKRILLIEPTIEIYDILNIGKDKQSDFFENYES